MISSFPSEKVENFTKEQNYLLRGQVLSEHNARYTEIIIVRWRRERNILI